jgi:hypothetical protein
MTGVVTTQKTESNQFTLKTYYKIGHRVQEMLHLDLFSSVSNVCIFPVFTGPPGESSCPQKRESFMFYMASPDHTFRKKQGQFFLSSVFTNSLELQILNNFIRISKMDNLCISAVADPIYPSSITGLEISRFFNRLLLQCSKNTADDAKIAEKLLKNT